MGEVWKRLAVVGLALIAQQVAIRASGLWYSWLPFVAILLVGLPVLRPARPAVDGVIPPAQPPMTPSDKLLRALLLFGTVGVAAAAADLAAMRRLPVATLGLWVLGMASMCMTTWRWRITAPLPATRVHRDSMTLLVAAVLVLAVLLRISWLEELPRYYFADESRAGMFVRNVFRDGIPPPFSLGWNTWSMIGLGLQGLFGPWLGLNTFSVRLAATLFGSITVLATYLLSRELFDRRTAVLAAALLAFNRTAIDFSRIGTLHAQAMAIETVAFFFLWRAIHSGSALAYAGCGIATALCLHTYNAAHVVPLLVAGWVVLDSLLQGGGSRPSGRGAAIALLAFGLTSLPWIHHLTDGFQFGHNWRQFTWMAQARQITPQILQAWDTHGAAAALELMAAQIWKTWLGFTVIPAEAYHLGYRGGGMLDYVAAPLFILGLGMAAAYGRRGGFLLYWWGLTTLTGGALTLDPPAFVRLVGLIPAVCILAALPLRALLDAVPAPSRVNRGIVLTLLLASLADNWRTYFIDFASSSADDMSELVHFVRGRPAASPIYLLGAEHFLRFTHDVDVEQFAFDFPDRHLEDVAEPGRFLPITGAVPHGPIYVVLGPTQSTLEAYARRLYPRLEVGEVWDHAKQRLIFRYLELEQTDLEAARAHTTSPALHVEYVRNGEVMEERDETQMNVYTVERFFRSPRHLLFAAPYQTRWRGSLRIPAAGHYHFEVVSSGPCMVRLGGETVCQLSDPKPERPQRCEWQSTLADGPVDLQAEWEAVVSPHSTRQIFQLYWIVPNRQRELVPPEAFAPVVPADFSRYQAPRDGGEATRLWIAPRSRAHAARSMSSRRFPNGSATKAR